MKARTHLVLAVLYLLMCWANLIVAALGSWPMGWLNIIIAFGCGAWCVVNLRHWQNGGT